MLKILKENFSKILNNLFSIYKDNLFILICFSIIFLVMKYVFLTFAVSVISYVFILINFKIILFFVLFLTILLLWILLVFLAKHIFGLYKTKRFDIYITYFFIIFLLFHEDEILSKLTLVYIITIFIVSLALSIFIIYKSTNTNNSILIKDKPLDKDDIDELWFNDKVNDFSEVLYNAWSKDNQVFWLVAEWWAWKSSFLNKLKETDIISKKCIYIEFNPWYYENEKELLESFLDNIKSHLKKENFYLPALSKTFGNFIKLLEKNSNSLFWLNLSFSSNDTLENLKDKIDSSLKSIDKKIIIVIDDLDRISSNKLKEVFRIVDLCRGFHNTSYILCYDPLNFNSIDIDLKQIIRQKEKEGLHKEILHIDSESVDNKELVKYMAKIINVYYPLTLDKVKLKEYFKKLFTDWEYIKFSGDSIESIKTWIDNLFTLEEYRLWGKYYSNIRWLKRILNNLRSCTYGKSNVNLFHRNHWVQFDTLVKFSILSLYFNDLFIDIDNECSINELNGWYSINNKYYLPILDKKENPEYIRYVNTLDLNRKQLLLNIIPLINENWWYDYDNKYEIRKFNNINKYLNILNNRKEEVIKNIDYNVFITSKINEYKNSTKTLGEIFQAIKEKYHVEWLDSFIREFREQIYNWKTKDNFKIKKSIEFINYIINYDDFYKISEELDFTFYIDIAKILDSSVSENNTPENCAYIWEYFYWEWVYDNEKALYIKFLDKWESLDEEWKILSLRESLRLLFSLDKSRWWNFFNFWTWMWDISKLYNWIFSEFKSRYVDSKNIFKIIFDWEKNIEKKWHSEISHITYMLTHYSDENSKKELSEYFIKCFEENLEYFLKFLESFIKDNDNFDRRTGDEYYIDINGFFENFIKEDVIKFINNKKEEITQIANKRLLFPSMYQWWEVIETNQKDLFEKFLKRI